jgi:hypothetical protein
MKESLYKNIVNYSRKINWLLLLSLLLVLNVKMAIKVVALVLLVLLFNKKLVQNNFLRQKFVWFYFSMIIVALVNLIINVSSFSTNYAVAFLTGIGFWIMCIMAAALNYRFVTNTGTSELRNTITLFFLLNALFTLAQLATFMYDAGSINPYTFQGMNQKYFIGTGDLLRGITFDVSTTNAMLNAFAIIYFLDRRKFHWLILCMTVLLLTASNFTNLLLLVVLLFQFLFQSNRNQKSIIVLCLFMLIIFLAKISPQNKHYLNYVWQKASGEKIDTIRPVTTPPLLSSLPDSMLNTENKKRKKAMLYLDSIDAQYEKNIYNTPGLTKQAITRLQIKPSIPKANIHTEPYQRKRDTSASRKHLIEFAINNIPSFDTSLRQTRKQKWPGKFIALQQTAHFIEKHPFKILTGAGIGRFSSKLAFRTTALQFAGGYPARFIYINSDFRDNHLNLYLNYFSKDKEVHSLMNSPDSVYDQLLAEYGLTGLTLFLIFYVAYFFSTRRKKSYGLPLLLFILGAFAIGYWFEQLSIVVVFELLMLLNKKEVKEQVV